MSRNTQPGTTAHDDDLRVEHRGATAPERPAGDPYGARDERYYRDDSETGLTRTFSGINVLLGIWLVIAPWVIGYGDQTNAVWNHTVIGIAVAVLALVRVAAPHTAAALSWVNVVLGAWLIVSPFVLVYEDGGPTVGIYWNDILVGAAIMAMGIISALATHSRDDDGHRDRT
ncbi:SPW repeat protein [Aquipuribacter nitratireducens]|uniref:SPW repeat protein n=1 Tax=Aquipuribacter nitratireducens TaxID=650104 RepID=A0ABW0GTZ7_9MICO